MIHGAHVILYSQDADADRAFFRDVLQYPSVDAGGGWLIFALPPAEIAIHPAEKPSHELYLMCDDVKAFIRTMTKKGVACGAISEQRWGSLTSVVLPSGSKLGVYEPHHKSPIAAKKKKAPKKKVTAKKKASPKKKAAPKKKAR